MSSGFESLAGTEFDVGRKGLTANLFDLTRESWLRRQQQGLLSGMPREFERLGMGQTGRQFQALDTAFRKDIFGKRKGFEEDTINRILDLMKGGAEPLIHPEETFGDFSGSLNPELQGYINQKYGDESRDITQNFFTYLHGSGLIRSFMDGTPAQQRAWFDGYVSSWGAGDYEG